MACWSKCHPVLKGKFIEINQYLYIVPFKTFPQWFFFILGCSWTRVEIPVICPWCRLNENRVICHTDMLLPSYDFDLTIHRQYLNSRQYYWFQSSSHGKLYDLVNRESNNQRNCNLVPTTVVTNNEILDQSTSIHLHLLRSQMGTVLTLLLFRVV